MKPRTFNYAILLAILTFSTANAAEEDGIDEWWGPQDSGVRLSLRLEPQSIRVGQPIVAWLTLENVGDEDVLVTQTSPLLVMRFDVQLPNGEMAPLTLEGKRQSSDPTEITQSTLKPGEKCVDGVPMLNRLYDMTLLGEYRVTAHRDVLLRQAINDSVPSNMVTIIVHDRQDEANPQKANDSK